MFRYITATTLLLSCLFGLMTVKASHEKGVVHILAGSELFLTGRTNINAFSCNCEQNFDPLLYQLNPSSEGFTFHATELKIPVQSLNCGRKAINRDLYEALCAEEHPNISIRPLSIDLPHSQNIEEECWIDLMTKTAVELAGETREVLLPVEVCAMGNDQWHLRSRKTLSMLDFGIDPPVALAGIIKVREHIDIHFDLVLAHR